jgi:hypothetical protein
MQNISSYSGLKSAIQLLEVEQDVKAQLFKDQLRLTFESIKPINLIRKSLQDISSSPDLVDNILGVATGIASGFLTRKIFIGASGNVLRKILGTVLQFGVTNVVAKHPETVKTVGQTILNLFHRKKGPKPE